MDQFLSIILILVPASAVMFGMYLTVKTFVSKEFEKTKFKSEMNIKMKNHELILPARLSAYERVILLLERISLSSIVLRINDPQFNVAVFHQQLLAELRNEFNHNMSQQIYVSDEAWGMIRKAVEETTAIINHASSNIEDKDESGVKLAKMIFNIQAQATHDPVQEALLFVKNEVRKLF